MSLLNVRINYVYEFIINAIKIDFWDDFKNFYSLSK